MPVSGKSGGDALLDGDIDLSGYFGDPDAGDTVSYRLSVSHDGTALTGAALAAVDQSRNLNGGVLQGGSCFPRRCRRGSDGLGDLVGRLQPHVGQDLTVRPRRCR